MADMNNNQRNFLKFLKTSLDDENKDIENKLQIITGETDHIKILKSCRDAIKQYDEKTVIQLNRISNSFDILVLKGKLKEAYEILKDNPLDVPQLLISKDTEMVDSIDDFYDATFEVTGIDPDEDSKDYSKEFNLDYIDSFVIKCIRKVNDLKDAHGNYKKTDLTKDAKVITFSKRRELQKARKPMDDLLKEKYERVNKIEFPKNPTIEFLNLYEEEILAVDEWFTKENKPLYAKWMKVVHKATEVPAKGLTEWEKKLLEQGYAVSYLNKEISTPY